MPVDEPRTWWLAVLALEGSLIAFLLGFHFLVLPRRRRRAGRVLLDLQPKRAVRWAWCAALVGSFTPTLGFFALDCYYGRTIMPVGTVHIALPFVAMLGLATSDGVAFTDKGIFRAGSLTAWGEIADHHISGGPGWDQLIVWAWTGSGRKLRRRAVPFASRERRRVEALVQERVDGPHPAPAG